MGPERPLEGARKRIEQRNKQVKVSGRKIKNSESSEKELEKELLKTELLLAECDYVVNVYPEPLRLLQGDVAKTIEERERLHLTVKPVFEFDTHSDKRLVELFKMSKNPVKSVSFDFSATIVEKGRTELRIIFGPGGVHKEKHPDIESRIFFEVTYNERKNLVSWIMGDVLGTEIKTGESKEDKNSWVLREHDGYVEGSIEYSEENMDKLAEDLVTQIDLGRYKYVVHDLPSMKLQ